MPLPHQTVACAAALMLAAGASFAADDAFEPVTPYRPSVSSPAQLPAAGQVEFEFGGLQQRSADARRTCSSSRSTRSGAC